MNAFDQAFQNTVGLEGGYSNNPADKGGETMYGITQAVARASGYTGAMSQLPLATAKQIYKTNYWDVMKLDQIANLSPFIALKLFDTGVNMGTSTPSRFLQHALNCLNANPNLAEDGAIGAATINSLKDFLTYPKGESIILKMLNAQQCIKYMDIVAANRSQVIFIKGWIANRIN